MIYEKGSLEEILEAKENRARIQRELINVFKTSLIPFTLNIPGPEKNNSIFTKMHKEGTRLLEEELKKQNIEIKNCLVRVTPAGNEAFLNVTGDPILLKKITVGIEEKHQLGRLFDFDVFNADGEQISRVRLGLPVRKCMLCNESAKICGRSRKHSVEDLLNKIYSIIDDYQ